METPPASSSHLDRGVAGGFQTTRWTQVIEAKSRTDEGLGALRELCAAYYAPVLAFLRRSGHGPDEAHEFFAEVLEGGTLAGAERVRGRFRSYLLGAVKHFLSHQRDAERRLCRGGGVPPLSLDADDAVTPKLAIADDAQLSPDAAFDRQWALTTLDRALEVLRKECAAEGRERWFERLQPQLTGAAEHGDQTALAEALGMNLNSLKSTVLRLKRRFRALVKAQIAITLDDDSAVDTELAALFAALRGS